MGRERTGVTAVGPAAFEIGARLARRTVTMRGRRRRIP